MILAFVALAAATVPSGHDFACTPVRVWDGDGPIWCREGPRIRLGGISAREIDGSCRKGHPCPRASGTEARDRLVGMFGGAKGRTGTGHILVVGPVLRCRSTGSARRDRTGAWCTSPATGDVSCAMLRSGTVARWDRYAGKHCR